MNTMINLYFIEMKMLKNSYTLVIFYFLQMRGSQDTLFQHGNLVSMLPIVYAMSVI